nr:universal stress protein [Nonomuraea basaltis]
MSPVVVGVDGSPDSFPLAAWAGKEAGLRRAPLLILHAISRHRPQRPTAELRALLEHAALRARMTQPHISITTEIVAQEPVPALVEHAAHAQLLVTGRGGQDALSGGQLGSVNLRLLHSAPCPIAVVGRNQRRHTGEVVAGLTGHPCQEPVVEFAFEEASMRASALRAVHTWTWTTPYGPGTGQPPLHSVDTAAEEATRLLAEAITPWQEKFPDVVVRRTCGHAASHTALIDASAHADLLILGLRACGLTGPVPGSTAHAVLRRAKCPIVVVRR